jgi:alpha-mannosidase
MSTPSSFVTALQTENIEWPVRNSDFFPYISDPGVSWTGYYSSRPSFKKNVKDVSALHAAEAHLFARKIIN